MNKTTIDVPKGIRYLSDWKEFSLPTTPTIINKQITGCGFTEYCIRNNDNVILVSPRKILLENKEQQHKNEVLYLKNDLDNTIDVGKDLNKDNVKDGLVEDKIYTEEEKERIKQHIINLRNEVQAYYYNTHISRRGPCKILVTYDSFRHVKEALGKDIESFYVVVDEFQSIFTDSRFKSDTELEFLYYLNDISKLCFVSATPMMDEYLEMLDEFCDLPFVSMDWGALDPGRIIKPELTAKPCSSILPVAESIIKTYQVGNFQKYVYKDENNIIKEIESKELVIYVNSVKNICDIIRRCGLTYSNTNVLCSNTPENQKKIRKAFGLRSQEEGGIGEVPGKGDPHKMFTLCTRTVYLGADFYSTCARSLILSDANIECLAVDITLDLPQILGRQRLLENPWKNRAELYYKSIIKTETFEQFMARIERKKKNSEEMLLNYESAEFKNTLAKNYQKMAKAFSYKDDYVAVNTRGGRDLFPIFNKLVMISELRAYQIQQIDYKDRFTVINQVREEGTAVVNLSRVEEFLITFDSLSQFTDKMKLLYDASFEFNEEEMNSILFEINIIYRNYFTVLGRDRIRALQFRKYALDAEYEKLYNNQHKLTDLNKIIFSTFLVGKKYTKLFIKDKLSEIYKTLGINLSPKANDIENYFEVAICKVTNKETGKRDHCYGIIKKKDL